MNRKLIALLVAAAAFVAVQNSASAQLSDTDTQLFRVTVPRNVTITALGADPAIAVYDPTAVGFDPFANLAFVPQPWEVKGNVLTGVNVNFTTQSAFTHTIDPTWKRDVTLGLTVASTAGPAVWTAGVVSDTTNYGGGDETATVNYTSDGVGRATFNLAVECVTIEFGTFAAGDYEMIVLGTVTENP